jgi:stage V sporulation protein B
MLQHVLIPKGIFKSGKSWAEALSSYGALHGMAMPLILFPSAFITAFAGLLVPEVSECCAQSNTERLRRVSYRALSFSLFFSIGVSGIILCFSRELGLAIYNNEETALYIRMLAPLIPVMYIDGAVDAILKGSGHQVYSMNVNIIDTLTACLFAITLIPKIGIMGYVISIYATEILNTTLSLIKMISVSRIRPRIFHQVFMPIICVIGATNASRLALRFLCAVESSNVRLVAGIIIAIIIYILLLFITRTVTSEEQEFLNASLLSEKQYDLRFGIHEAR